MSEIQRIAIIGAGGLAREVAWILESRIWGGELELLGFVEKENGSCPETHLSGYPCRKLQDFLAQAPDLREIHAECPLFLYLFGLAGIALRVPTLEFIKPLRSHLYPFRF